MHKQVVFILCSGLVLLSGCTDSFKGPPKSEGHYAAIEFAKKQPPLIGKKIELFIRNVEQMRFAIKKEPYSPDMDDVSFVAACTGQPGYILSKDGDEHWTSLSACSQGYDGLDHASKTKKFTEDIKIIKDAAGYKFNAPTQIELGKLHSCKGDVAFAIGKDVKGRVFDTIVCVLKDQGEDRTQTFLKQAQLNQSSGLLNDEVLVVGGCEGVVAHTMVRDTKGGVGDAVACFNAYN